MGNAYIIVVDGLGVGAQEDAVEYGDQSMNTLGHVSEQTGVQLPNLQKMGIGNIIPLPSVSENENPIAAFGKLREVSAGKDSTTGHWEIAGIQLDKPFPTYPNGFPQSVIEDFCEGIGVEKALCNKPYSGTDVIRDYGEEHLKTGNPIVYTSADSVFQVACHNDVVSVEKLYEWCEFARNEICIGEHEVGRVIARPFTGEPGNFERISDKRHDYSSIPPENNLVQKLYDSGIKTYSIGKVADLFAGNGFTQYRPTKSNAEGISQLLSLMSAQMNNCFVFMNLIDTDQLFGHRLDPEGYAGSLEEFDRAIPAIVSKIREEDLLIITGDHGNDPCSESTDHSREFVPLLVFPKGKAASVNLETGETFSNIANSVADFFGLEDAFPGRSFLADD
ncbi:MAG: phosphopentomutase [Balneola sp.]|jgi:phosphopentomutase|nr:phosphopentomutase [Balneola sp.]MBE80365.1 phosphopentomutase [Balneola sp.]HBX65665.1 phosphopentomutase [Balneolaceae bacterium]|tara:strand:+ start:1030 stop:2202 length:1173 start_codon:yes stop_codon:yes gene_type:complete